MLKSFKAGLFALLAISMTIAIQPAFAEEAATTEAAPEVNSPDKVVQNVCAACHGADGNSVITTNPKLAGQHPEYLFKQLTNFKDGTRANAVMSGMASALSGEDMEGIAKYFSNQSIKLAKAKENGKGSLGEKIYRGGIAATKTPACAACHGVTGAGLPKQFPRLAGQHTEYTVQQLRTFRTGERANAPMMATIAAKMSDAEMQAVADYIQGLR